MSFSRAKVEVEQLAEWLPPMTEICSLNPLTLTFDTLASPPVVLAPSKFSRGGKFSPIGLKRSEFKSCP